MWASVITQQLSSEDEYQFNVAAHAAEIIGMDTWEHRFSKLLAGMEQLYCLVDTPNAERFDRVLDYARSHIDLNAMFRGNKLGPGPHYTLFRKLDCILHALTKWPGRGADFINAGLRSPFELNRSTAAQAVLRWAPVSREPFLKAVEVLYLLEKRPAVKSAVERIMNGEFDSIELDNSDE